MNYSQLCKALAAEDVLKSLLEVIAMLSDSIVNYYQMFNWHKFRRQINDSSDEHRLSGSSDFEMIMKFVDKNRKVVWEHIQEKITIFLENEHINNLSFDKFLQVFYAVSMVCRQVNSQQIFNLFFYYLLAWRIGWRI